MAGCFKSLLPDHQIKIDPQAFEEIVPKMNSVWAQ
jgi:hypothetical protein